MCLQSPIKADKRNKVRGPGCHSSLFFLIYKFCTLGIPVSLGLLSRDALSREHFLEKAKRCNEKKDMEGMWTWTSDNQSKDWKPYIRLRTLKGKDEQ
jgi:hypothetical protein